MKPDKRDKKIDIWITIAQKIKLISNSIQLTLYSLYMLKRIGQN